MSECPVKNCEEVREIKTVLFGPEGTTGLLGCLRKFVTKKAVWIAITAIGIPLIATGIKVWSGQEHAPLRYASKAEITEFRSDLAALQANQRYFKETMDEIKSDRKEQSKTLELIYQKLHNIELRLPREGPQ